MTVYALTMLGFEAELDILEIRLAELDPVVDVHVIAEANVTFSGRPKPYWLQRDWERFKPWHEKIEHVLVDDMPAGDEVRRGPRRPTDPSASSAWDRENHQRRALGRALGHLKDDDMVLLSDLDEIPRALTVGGLAESAAVKAGLMVRPALAMFVYRMCWRWRDPLPVIARMFSGRTLRYDFDGDVQVAREAAGTPLHGDHGWHLAYMGGIQAVQTKLHCAAHHELARPEFTSPRAITRARMYGSDLFGRRDRDHEPVAAAEDEWPPYLLANRERFGHLL